MKRRTARKLFFLDRAWPYGDPRASGSKKGRRGRKAFLRLCPSLKNRDHLHILTRLELLARDLAYFSRG